MPAKRKVRKVRAKVRKQLVKDGIPEKYAERLAELVVPDIIEIMKAFQNFLISIDSF
ncbi:MAG: hypothetical protein HYU02_03870 [Thaumarchaeota archaeon]|nr:hypothetical protein [Nitrososphaerota archaeon]